MDLSHGWSSSDLLLTGGAALGVLGVAIMALGGANLLDFPPSFLPVIGSAFAAVAMMRRAAWAYLTAAILLSLLPLMIVFAFLGIGLFLRPLAGPEQVVVVALTGSLVFSLWGGIGGFRAIRRGSDTPATEFLASRRGLAAILFSGFLLGTAFTGAMASQQALGILNADSGIVPDARATFVITDFEFPTGMALQAGKVTEVTVLNKDPVWHTFTFEQGGKEYSYHLIGGGSVKFLVQFNAPGEVAVRCLPHSSGYTEGMVGRITVTA